MQRKVLGCGKITSGKSDLLSICIPTYNHAGPLTKCLEALIPQATEYNIPIYVSDNASTDNTSEVLKAFEKTYPFLYFRIQNRNLGVDHNMVNAARMASTRYVWTFGSRRILLPGMLDKIYEILKESDWDLLVLNDLNSTFMVPESKKYNSAEKVFKELNRNLTGLGFQILPSEAWKSETVQKYEGTEWAAFGLTLEYIASKQKLKVFFLSNPCATSSGDSQWKSKSFQIWANWKKVVYSLPKTYSDDDKERVIRKSVDYFFGEHKFNLMHLRSKHIYNSNIFNAFREDLMRYGNLSPTAAYVISRFPVAPLKLYYSVYHVLRAFARKFIHQKAPLNPATRRVRRISYA